MSNQKFDVWALDVWGHIESDPKNCDCTGECPGYTVNNPIKVGTVEIGDQDPVLRTLIEAGYLASDCTWDTIKMEGDPDFMLEINRKSDGKYLLQLTPVE